MIFPGFLARVHGNGRCMGSGKPFMDPIYLTDKVENSNHTRSVCHFCGANQSQKMSQRLSPKFRLSIKLERSKVGKAVVLGISYVFPIVKQTGLHVGRLAKMGYKN